MAAPKTVTDLISELRSLTDEANEIAIDDTRDILPAFNRAQQYARNILARRYPDPVLGYSTLVLNSTDQEYDLPEGIFEDRIEKIEIAGQLGVFVECKRISFMDVTEYEQTMADPQPYYYTIIGRKIRFIPKPLGTYNARVWYIKDPDNLVKDQGRIYLVNTVSNYIRVDSVGTDLTTDVDALNSYVNLVNGQTGEIKASLQVQNIDGDKITFKTVPSRTTVFNQDILAGLAALPTAVTIEKDDYICTIYGTCILYFGDALSNFIIQYAAFQVQQKLGTATGTEQQLVDKFEKQLERQWSGRETTLRIHKSNRIWNMPYRRWFWR